MSRSTEFSEYSRGFTLTEVLIVLAILAVLVAIALPSYQASISQGRRADGRAYALDLAVREEAYFLRNGSYTGDLETESGLNASVLSQERFYTGSVGPCAGGDLVNCFQVKVSALGLQRASDQACVSLTITNTGERGSSDSMGVFSDANSAARCW